MVEATLLLAFATDDNLTEELDFGEYVRLLWLHIPTVDSAAIDIQMALAAGGTFLDIAASVAGVADTGAKFENLADAATLEGVRYIKIATSAAQTANRTFTLVASRM